MARDRRRGKVPWHSLPWHHEGGRGGAIACRAKLSSESASRPGNQPPRQTDRQTDVLEAMALDLGVGGGVPSSLGTRYIIQMVMALRDKWGEKEE